MRRKALPLLLAATLTLGGYAAFQRVASMESGARKTDSIEGPAHMEDEKSMYKETTENVIYLAGGCFWGMEQLMQSIPRRLLPHPESEDGAVLQTTHRPWRFPSRPRVHQ